MSTDLMRPEPGRHALMVVEPGHDLHPAGPRAPSSDDPAGAATTWDPRHRVPQADAEEEC